MKDLEIILENVPGSLARLGETLGKSNISIEGGGVFQSGDHSIAHFLVAEAEKAREELSKVGIFVVKINAVLVQKLRQDIPGQLGMFCRKLSDAGVNILVQYSDHSNHLIVVVDDFQKGEEVSRDWMRQWW
jgi:hypothetical protein